MATIKYLSEDGVRYLWQKIKLKYATIDSVPSKVSDLTNDSNFQTQTQVSNAISAAIAGIKTVEFRIVSALPQTGEANVIYLVSHTAKTDDIYDEYIYVDNKWEKIGTTDIDLSGYVRTSDLVAITNAEIDDIVDES